MTDSEKQQLETAVANRGEDTAAIAVFTQPQPDSSRLGIAFCAIDDLTGEHEHAVVRQLCKDAGGDLRAVSVFRWPIGTSDEKILSTIVPELDIARSVAFQVKPSMPYRYCWGRLGGKVDEQFVKMVAPRVAQCREMVEIRWEQSLPLVFVATVRQEDHKIEWGASITATPDKVAALTDDDVLFQAVKDAANEHQGKYDRHPKVVAVVSFFKKMSVRDIAGRLSEIVFSLGRWSEPYEDNQQMCHWICD